MAKEKLQNYNNDESALLEENIAGFENGFAGLTPLERTRRAIQFGLETFVNPAADENDADF